jgi:ligand-binding SRPBCC domain-containing protein
MVPPHLRGRIEDVRIQPPPVRPVAQDPARRLLSVAAGAGTEILISFCPLPWVPTRISWMARIVEFAWNSHFTDEQMRGPFRSFRQRHGIVAQVREGTEGTLVTDQIDFALPWGWAGTLGEPVICRQFRKAFVYRHKRLPEILAAAQAQAARRA